MIWISPTLAALVKDGFTSLFSLLGDYIGLGDILRMSSDEDESCAQPVNIPVHGEIFAANDLFVRADCWVAVKDIGAGEKESSSTTATVITARDRDEADAVHTKTAAELQGQHGLQGQEDGDSFRDSAGDSHSPGEHTVAHRRIQKLMNEQMPGEPHFLKTPLYPKGAGAGTGAGGGGATGPKNPLRISLQQFSEKGFRAEDVQAGVVLGFEYAPWFETPFSAFSAVRQLCGRRGGAVSKGGFVGWACGRGRMEEVVEGIGVEGGRGVGCRVKGHGGGWWRRRWEWRGWWGRGWWWREVVGEGMVVGGGVESKAPEKGGGLLTSHTGRPGNSY